jgi:peptidyl-tRNA hydrolase, PTH1 family
MTWLVAGLGNPGPTYARTRHNAGAMVADVIAAREGTRFRKTRFVPAESAEFVDSGSGARIVLAKSTRFMNESGPSYASVARKAKVDPSHLIAVHDEIDLPFGALHLKQGGGTAGHNGLRSLEQALRSSEFVRVRIGVGRPPGRQDPADFVLRNFSERERPEVEVLLQVAADAVMAIVSEGLTAAQDRFSRRRP